MTEPLVDLEQKIEQEWSLLTVDRAAKLLGLERTAFYSRLYTRMRMDLIHPAADFRGMLLYRRDDVLGMKDQLPRGRRKVNP